jgi:hypothetical protein
MAIAAKQAKAPQKTNPRWRELKGPLPAPPDMMVLLEVKGSVWTFQHPKSRVLYRCELDDVGNERGSPTFPNGWGNPMQSKGDDARGAPRKTV